MEKIKALLLKAGCKPELVDSICESLEKYKTTLRESLEKDFGSKIEAAKKLCVEETEAHKKELARRLQIFCETKSTAIESQLARQSALSETEAVSKLKKVFGLLEGIELNGQQNGNTIAVEKHKRQIQQLKETNAQIVETANRQTAIAEKALKHNRQLVSENPKLKGLVQRPTASLTEGRRSNSSKIDTQRRGGTATTTRPTLLESQDRRPAKPRTEPLTTTKNPYDINTIAEQLE